MTRRLVALLVCGVVLAACGTQTPGQALHAWVTQSDYSSAVSTMRADARHALTALEDASSTANELHTVCEILHDAAEQANSSLPTPDDQTTNLLGRAYGQFGSGASLCWSAGSSVARRARAGAELQKAASTLAEASARIAAAS